MVPLLGGRGGGHSESCSGALGPGSGKHSCKPCFSTSFPRFTGSLGLSTTPWRAAGPHGLGLSLSPLCLYFASHLTPSPKFCLSF